MKLLAGLVPSIIVVGAFYGIGYLINIEVSKFLMGWMSSMAFNMGLEFYDEIIAK